MFVKRRPWRDKVRKKARKEALKASREKLKATTPGEVIVSIFPL